MARNKRPRKPYKAREAVAPMIAVLHTNPVAGLSERTAVDAFVGGWQEAHHFDVLADCRDMLALGAEAKKDESACAVSDLAAIALNNLRDRYRRTGRLVPTGEELQALRVLIETSEDFWSRQSGALYSRAYLSLKHHRRGDTAAVQQEAA